MNDGKVELDELREAVREFLNAKSPQTAVRAAVETGYDPAVWDQMARQLGPPTVFQPVLDAPRGHDFSSLRVVMASSRLTPPELLRRVRDEIKPDVIANGYGLTEATSLVTAAEPSIDDFEHIVTTVGRPAWDVEVRLVDEQGHDVPAERRGSCEPASRP